MRSPRLLTAAGTCCSTQILRKYSAHAHAENVPRYAAKGSRLVRRKLEGWTMPAGRRLLTAPGWLVLGLALAANAQTLATSGRVSTTAESVCVLRAIAAKHLDPKVRNPDYLAEKFVSAEFWRASPFRDDPDRARHNPNYFWVNARTHHMDALLVGALSTGATQVGPGVDPEVIRIVP